MIFRAVDDDGNEPADLGPRAAPVAWVIATLCGIALCMLDLSSLLSQSGFTSSFGLLSLLRESAITIDAEGANLLTGYGFACFWMVSREGYTWPSAAWCTSQLLLGNLVLCVYFVHALYISNGNWTAFWCGRRTFDHAASDKVHRHL
ncbi:hypothetical protein ACHHYP_20407 [Achlya hypogyna]|uniref:Uncharacterized protein n=1 Tax=Achlya hypogyna TaxID=1202772 RepID=A0A1V9ZJ69_ACHHY|nr:hypothetical protein ACHHYP_20407 [Achlya hypogyna]